MESSIKKIISEKLNYIFVNLKTMTAGEISQEMVELSSLLGSLGENIVNFDIAVANQQIALWEKEEGMSAKEAEIRTKVTEEYKRYALAKILEKAMMETIRSLKFRLRVLSDEREVARNL